MRTSRFLLAALLHVAAVRAGINWDIIHHGVVDTFKWQKPFTPTGEPLSGFEAICQEFDSFSGTQYKHSDLKEAPPLGLAPYADALEALFTSRMYPGGWDGANLHGEHRDLVMFDYDVIPELAQKWIEEKLADPAEKPKRFFGVFEKVKEGEKADPNKDLTGVPAENKVFITAPAELYDSLPLWVAKGSKCEAEFSDLSKYWREARDKSTAAWPVQHGEPDRENGKREITMKIEGQYLHETPEGREYRLFWEKAHVAAQRQHRKNIREERQKKKKDMSWQHESKDEL